MLSNTQTLSSKSRTLSLAGLRGFEAAARLASLTKAAAELHLTQSAISRQVQGLEDELGVPLFVRKAREISLTTAGMKWLPEVQSMLRELDMSVERLRRNAQSPRIAISTFASFASLWLIPRLGSFREQFPNVDLDVGATDRLVDLEAEDIDFAVRYLQADDAPPDSQLLFKELVFPLVSPQYLAKHKGLTRLEDLSQHTLIESTAGGPAETQATWPAFFQGVGKRRLKGRSELRFDFIAQSFAAAERSQGVALSRSFGADHFMRGELVRPALADFTSEFTPRTGCYLIASPRISQRPETVAFAKWLSMQAQLFNGEVTLWLAKTARKVNASKSASTATNSRA